MRADIPRRDVERKQGDAGNGVWFARWAGIASVFAALLWMPQAWLLASAVGSLVSKGQVDNLFTVAIFVVLIGCLRAVFDASSIRLSFKAARPELIRRRRAAVAGLAEGSPPARTSGQCASILGEQADSLLPYLTRYNVARLKAVAVPLVFVVVVAFHSWVSALILLVSAPLIPVFMALIGWRAQAASERQLAATGSLNGFLLDRLRGLSTIRSLKAVDRTAIRLRGNAENLRQRTMSVLRIAFLSSAVLELFAALGVALIAVYVGFSLLGAINGAAWGDAIDLPTGLFVLLMAPAFFEPLRELSAVWHDKATGVAALKALEGLAAKTPQGGSSVVEPQEKTDKRAAVQFRNVSHAYAPGCPQVLRDLDITIRRGEKVALVGASGAGKSTVLGLMAGLLDPVEGRVAINGQFLCPERMEDVRRSIGWIGQAAHIFAGTIRSNIAMGRNLPRKAVDDAIALAGLERVAALHGHRILGEAGVGLSGGEIVRLSIARAVVDADCSIILADEPTAHLDPVTAGEIAASLLRVAHGRTLIVATHDPVLAAQMERTIVIGDAVWKEAAE